MVPMSKNDIRERADRLYNDCIRFHARVEDVKQIAPRLPEDQQVLRALAQRCQNESRKALHIGHHTEGRRLGVLADQLGRLAAALDR
jgi:hypothetical protein